MGDLRRMASDLDKALFDLSLEEKEKPYTILNRPKLFLKQKKCIEYCGKTTRSTISKDVSFDFGYV